MLYTEDIKNHTVTFIDADEDLIFSTLCYDDISLWCYDKKGDKMEWWDFYEYEKAKREMWEESGDY